MKKSIGQLKTTWRHYLAWFEFQYILYNLNNLTSLSRFWKYILLLVWFLFIFFFFLLLFLLYIFFELSTMKKLWLSLYKFYKKLLFLKRDNLKKDCLDVYYLNVHRRNYYQILKMIYCLNHEKLGFQMI